MSLLALAALPATASATSTQAEIDAAVGKAAAYARQQQTPSGEIPGFGSEWMAASLAAAGVNAADVRVAPGDPSLQDYWLGEYGSAIWGDEPPLGLAYEYEAATIVSRAVGLDPARLSAVSNQPAQVAASWSPAAGSFGEPSSNSTIFGILAMRTTPLPAWALAPAVEFLRRNQHDDGGWTYQASPTPESREAPGEEDMTGAAIAALCAAGAPPYDPAVSAAVAFLQGRQDEATGGIEWLFGPANADTDAWVLSGLTACGIDPQSSAWTTGAGKTPVDFLLSLQVPSGPEAGGFGYEDASAANFYATQDVLRAIAGGGFTPASPAREDPSLPAVRPAPTIAPGTPVPHVLAIELAPGNVRLCKVTAPAEAPLPEVLEAARAGSHPAGCVTSFSVVDGRLATLDGVAPEGEDEAWLLRLDRHAEELAGEQPVGFGETIALRLGRSPSADRGPAGADGAAGAAGPAGVTGTAGETGGRGRRGARGRPGRNATISCRVRHRSHGAKTKCRLRQNRHSNTLRGR